MNSTMSGCSALRITILAARRVLPPDLITPANASKPFMNETGPEAVPPPASSSFDERIADRLLPVPEPYLNSMPSVLASPRIESIVSSTALMKQAEHCGAFSKPQLNQTGLLNAAFWCTSRCLRSSLNACSASSMAKYFWLARPVGDGVDDAADQLLDRAFALGRADVAAEIFRDDDVGGLLRPGLRHLDVALLEHDLALFVADDGIAHFPFDLVEGVGARGREVSRELEARGGLASCDARSL